MTSTTTRSDLDDAKRKLVERLEQGERLRAYDMYALAFTLTEDERVALDAVYDEWFRSRGFEPAPFLGPLGE